MTLARAQQIVRLSFPGFGDRYASGSRRGETGLSHFPHHSSSLAGWCLQWETTPHLLQALPSSALQRILGILLRGDPQQLLRKL